MVRIIGGLLAALRYLSLHFQTALAGAPDADRFGALKCTPDCAPICIC